jgi:hypothetical protein
MPGSQRVRVLPSGCRKRLIHSHSIIGRMIYLLEKQSEKIFLISKIPSRLPSKTYRL